MGLFNSQKDCPVSVSVVGDDGAAAVLPPQQMLHCWCLAALFVMRKPPQDAKESSRCESGASTFVLLIKLPEKQRRYIACRSCEYASFSHC